MEEHGAQYDHIGSKYDEYAQTATLKRAESYTVLRMVGPLAGTRVLDLACGFGFYTRLLKQQGAAQVIGIDISPEMVRLGREQEQAEPLGVTYQVYDATALPALGIFDLVTAIYLLNYATSTDELLGMTMKGACERIGVPRRGDVERFGGRQRERRATADGDGGRRSSDGLRASSARERRQQLRGLGARAVERSDQRQGENAVP